MRVLDPGPAFFGRRKDVEVLIARATEPGLTMVLGRPRMGKTTLLLETARRLSEEHGCLVGYHEWVGSSDMLRGAAEDLYERLAVPGDLAQPSAKVCGQGPRAHRR